MTRLFKAYDGFTWYTVVAPLYEKITTITGSIKDVFTGYMKTRMRFTSMPCNGDKLEGFPGYIVQVIWSVLPDGSGRFPEIYLIEEKPQIVDNRKDIEELLKICRAAVEWLENPDSMSSLDLENKILEITTKYGG